MTCDEVYAAKPGPDLDALVHRYYGDGSAVVRPYSTSWDTVSHLASALDLDLQTHATGGHIVMSVFRDGRYLDVGDSIDIERDSNIEVPPEVRAALAARSLLKLTCNTRS